MRKLLIGTSGYSYKHWKGVFYPSGLPQTRWLEFYCEHFDSVELDVTFYRLPARKAFEKWYQRTPPHFLFAAKGSRFITHVKRLKDCREPLRAYRENAAGLGDKLAVVLWQLPPGLRFDGERLREFCRLLHDEYPEKRRTFEFRHESWLQKESYDILASHGFALCIPVAPGYPREEQMTAPFTYIRFHGDAVRRNSCYTDKELRNWAAESRKWLEGQDLYISFNNDALGFVIDNAKNLRNYIKNDSTHKEP
jgi:uncharacterized protein YecE (DUF72 family)